MIDRIRNLDATGWAGVSLGILALTSTLSISISQIALGLCLVSMLWLRRTGRIAGGIGLGPIAAALIIWAVAMIPLSTDVHQSLVFSRRWYLLGGVWAGYCLCRGETMRRRIYAMMILGALSLAIVGFFQVFRYGLPNIDSFGKLIRRIELLQNYMTGGGLLMMTGLAALAGVLALPRGRMRWALIVILFPILLSLLLTMTRSAWLGFIAGSAVILRLKYRRGGILILVVAAVFYFLLPGVMKERLGSILDPQYSSNYERIAMWEKGLDLVGRHPLLGVGDRDLARISEDDWQEPLGWGHLHDNFLMFAVIWGLPGLILGSALLLWAGWLLLRAWQSLPRPGIGADPPADEPYRRVWVLSGIGVWTGFMVLGLFDWNFGDAEPVLLLWLVTGIALSAGIRPVPLDSGSANS